MIAKTPKPPYFAVIFTSLMTDEQEGYEEMADRMVELAAQQEGFLGIESARSTIGITVSYWESLAVIQKWKENSEHLLAQEKGKAIWYQSYKTRIVRVERDYELSISS